MAITRQEYLDASDSDPIGAHRAYYRQFVTPVILRIVELRFGKARLQASSDRHFNDVGTLRDWDNLSLHLLTTVRDKLRELGEGYSLSSGICILKAAASILAQPAAFYYVQGSYTGGVVCSEECSEFPNDLAAEQAGKQLLANTTFEGERVRVSTYDGELVWEGKRS